MVLAGMIAAKNTNVFSNAILPDKAKEYIDAGKISTRAFD